MVDLPVLVYKLDEILNNPVTLEWRGKSGWAICHLGDVFNCNGEWEWEPSPSNRSDEFIARTRYAIPEDAISHWRKTEPEVY